MLVNYVDSILYVAILYTVAVSLLLVILYILATRVLFPTFLNELKKHRNKKYKKLSRIYKRKIKPSKKTLTGCLIYIAIAFALTISMFTYRQEYAIAEEFVWSEEEQSGEECRTFCVSERTENEDMEWWGKSIDLLWYSEAFDRDGDGNYEIDRDGMEYYHNQIASEYVTRGERRDKTIESGRNDVQYENAKVIYEEIVKKDYSQLDSEYLWEGYKAGKIVVEYNYTSENVFQTGVLPEAAHENAFINNEITDDTIMYYAAMCEQFNETCQFEEMRIGEGEYTTIDDIFFRKGKGAYREHIWGVQDEVVKSHCGMKAYTYFDILVQNTEMENDKYMTYVYYSGRTCLDILPNISDDSLRKELCRKQLKYWDVLEQELGANYLSYYKVENKTVEELLQVKTQLENNIEE